MSSNPRNDFEEWYRRLAHEFGECPGLRLTSAQAARLWALDRERVQELLNALVHDQLLVQKGGDYFAAARSCPYCE